MLKKLLALPAGGKKLKISWPPLDESRIVPTVGKSTLPLAWPRAATYKNFNTPAEICTDCKKLVR